MKELKEMSNFGEPIVVRSVPDEIQHKILSLLSERKLLPGERLPAERELARVLQVSRTTLRDALSGLAARGVLKARPGSGWYVQLDTGALDSAIALHFQLSSGTVDQVLEARQAFEPVVAYHAALRRTDSDLSQMRTLLSEMQLRPSPARYLELADEMHRLIAAATHNPFFAVALRPMLDLMGESRHPEPHWSSAASEREHWDILAAIEARDCDQAAYAMARHLGGALVRSWLADTRPMPDGPTST